MPCSIGNLDYEFVVRSPDRAIEYVIGTFPVEVLILPGQEGQTEVVANMMLADAIREAADAVQAIVDTDPSMTEIRVDT